MKIVFFGSADFGIRSLEMLYEHGFDIVGIVSTPPKPRGRGLRIDHSPIVKYAQQRGVKSILTPQQLNEPAFIDQLIEFSADLFVVIAFRILPPSVFQIPLHGTVNVHASLLPLYRGAAPIQRAIAAGEKMTGVTVFRIDTGVDTGAVLIQKQTLIGDQETTPELYDRLSDLGAQALIEACDQIVQGKVTYVEQEPTQATRAPKLSKEESHIKWGESAQAIFNKIRAFKPYPGTWTWYNSMRLGIEWALPQTYDSGQQEGIVCSVSSEWFDVQCKKSVLRVLTVKPAGKKIMPVKSFLLGNKIAKGMKFE